MKHRLYTLKYVDHRKSKVDMKEKQYSQPTKYEKDLEALRQIPGVHVSQETVTVVRIYPESQGSLFEEEHGL